MTVLLWLEVGLAAPASPAEEPEAYLQGPTGPYRGRVVEVLTDKPLEGALVVTVWEQDQDGDRVVVAARELLTDTSGAFLVESLEIERALPPRTWPPRTLIYKHGYVALPREPGARFGVPTRRFVGAGAVVTLKAVHGGDEWTETFHTFYESLQRLRGESLRERLPHSLRALEDTVRWFAAESKRNPGYWGVEKSR